MEKAAQRTPDEIWAGDLFGRRAEAELLMAYVESVAQRPVAREDTHAFSIAVDCGYGEGKTFFLQRFAEHLSATHPVAFVDAWSDDLTDEPLTALAATLEVAIGPLRQKPSVKAKWAAVVKSSGEVAKIATAGLLRRAAAVLITGPALDASEKVLSAATEGIQEAADGSLKTSGQDIIEGAEAAIKRIAPQKLMKARIAAFQEGQAAIRQMKESLRALIGALEGDLKPPIVIVVDELDRCRPTYALKLLEEIKHLFDVPGLVFVFGMHGSQLAHSVRGAYGADFDGRAYLRRFIGRRYRLKEPRLEPLIEKLLARAGITTEHFLPFDMTVDRMDLRRVEPAPLLAHYMRVYRLSIRDAFHLTDMLQTCVALAKGEKLVLPYLIPMLISHMGGAEAGELVAPSIVNTEWLVVLIYQDKRTTHALWPFVKQLHEQFSASERELRDRLNAGNNMMATFAYELQSRTSNRLTDPRHYDELVTAVGRFSNPELEGNTS